MSSNSKAKVLCWQMCDGIHIDPATGKHYILGCFSSIRARQFPSVHPQMIWFLTVSDVEVGKHTLRISIGREWDKLQKVVEREFESKSPLHKLNLINQIQNLPFEAPGEHFIVIHVDDEPVLTTSLTVAN